MVAEYRIAWDDFHQPESKSLGRRTPVGDRPSESNRPVVVVDDGSPVAADRLVLNREAAMAVRGNVDQMVQHHDREFADHKGGRRGNDCRESGHRANVRCGYLRCGNGLVRAMPNQDRVDIRRSTVSDTLGHAEVDNQSVRYRWRHFRRGRQPQRKRESHDADS